MKTILLGLALALAGAPMATISQTSHDYQLIAAVPGATELGFVDAGSFDRTPSGVTYWTLSVYEPPALIVDSPPVIYQMRQRIADCAGRRTKDQIVMARLQNGAERWISLIGHYRRVRPGSIGESELEFVCSGKLPGPKLPAFPTVEAAVQFSDVAHQRGRPAAKSGL